MLGYLGPLDSLASKFNAWRAELGLQHPGTIENFGKEVKSESSSSCNRERPRSPEASVRVETTTYVSAHPYADFSTDEQTCT